MIRQTVIAYWLIPYEPARSFFQGIITELAHRYGAPVFQPHVTVHVGADQAGAAEKALREAAHRCKLVRLTRFGINHSDSFTKTLFVQFAMSPELLKMNAIICEAANDSAKYELKPHLSLLYKNLAVAIRRQLAASITVPFPEIDFDSLQAVRCVSPTEKGADVEAWELIAASMLV